MSSRAVPPVIGPPQPLRTPPLQRHTFANGLTVIVAEQASLPVVDVRLVTRSGAADDIPALAGRAHLMAETLDQGTTSRSATDIADQAELIGASLQTGASWDSSIAALHVLEPRFDTALELLADIAINAAFPDAEIERKRAERLTSIIQELDEPRALASIAFARALYGPEHPFGTPIGGTRDTVNRISQGDVVSFKHLAFRPDNAFIVVSGAAGAERVFTRIEELFGAWQAGGTAGASQSAGGGISASPAPARDLQAAVHVVNRAGASQSELRIGLPGPKRGSSDYFALLVGNTVLGGSFTSRLNMRLREEKAYTYGAGSSFTFRRDGGPFVASTAVDTAATADAVAVVLEEVTRMTAQRVPARELERAKQYLVLGLPRSWETTGDVAEHVSEVELYGLGDDYYALYAERVASVTPEQVTDAMSRWLVPASMQVVIAGDAERVVPELERMTIGAVHVSDG